MTYVMTESEAKELKNMTAAQLFDILGNHPYPGATNLSGGAMGFMCFQVDGLWIAYDKGMWNVERHETQYPITPNFPPFGELTVRDVHAEISRVVKIGKSHHANTRAVAVATETNTTPTWEEIKTNCVGLDLPTEQTFVSTDRYRELEAELAKVTAERDDLSVRVKQKTDVIKAQAAQIQQHSDGWEQTEAQLEAMTTERDEARKKYLALINNNPLSPTINTIAEKLGVCPAEPGPMFEAIDRLKSKAGLLSVVCRRLCGDENASIETVHATIDRCHDESTTLDFIGGRLGVDPNGTEANHLGEIRSLVAQAVKSLSEKTAEVAKLQEGLTNYEAQLKGYAANKQLQMLTRITKILRDAEIATVYDYEENRAIETDERVRIICERLKQNTVERRDDGAKMHKLVDEIRQAHLTLNAMSAPRCMGTIDLSLSARIRSLFTQKV